jgi:hypothetical protein
MNAQFELNFDHKSRKKPSLIERWRTYHAANPHVAKKLTDMAYTASRAGARNIGIAMLFEVLRWRTNIETVQTEGFKIADPLAAPYARYIMQENPELRGVFKLKKSEVDPYFNIQPTDDEEDGDEC